MKNYSFSFYSFQTKGMLEGLVASQQIIQANLTAILSWIKVQEDAKAQQEETESFVDAPNIYPQHVLPFDSWESVVDFDDDLGRINEMIDHYVRH